MDATGETVAPDTCMVVSSTSGRPGWLVDPVFGATKALSLLICQWVEATGSFCMDCTEHQHFLPSVEMRQIQVAPQVYIKTSWLLLLAHCTSGASRDQGCIFVVGVLLTACDLCSWVHRSTQYSVKNSISVFSVAWYNWTHCSVFWPVCWNYFAQSFATVFPRKVCGFWVVSL